jgi:hypothetical protein
MKQITPIFLLSALFLVACQQRSSVPEVVSSSSLSSSSESAQISSAQSAQWEVYKDATLDIHFEYPSDKYSVTALPGGNTLFFGDKTIAIDAGIHIADDVPEGESVQIYRTKDSLILEYLQQDKPFTAKKTVNGVDYLQFEFVGMGDMYGYVTQKNGEYYVFASMWGPDNPVSERMLQSLEFE